MWSVAVTADGATAVSGGFDGTVRVWDLATGPRAGGAHRPRQWVRSVAVTADGARAVSGGGTARCGCGTWPPDRRPANAHRPRRPGVGGGGQLRTGRGRSPAAMDGTVRVWDLAAGRDAGVARPATTAVCGRWRSPRTGARAVTGGEDGTVRVWDLATGTGAASSPATTAACGAVAVTADGRAAVSGGGDGTVRVWDLAAGPPRSGAHRPRRPVWCGGGHRGRAGRGQRRLRRHGAGVGPGRRTAEQAELTGHDGGVWRWRSPRTGPGAVTGGVDRTVRVWDLANGKEIARWTGDYAVECIALSGQPFKIAVGQRRGQPYLLELRGRENTI